MTFPTHDRRPGLSPATRVLCARVTWAGIGAVLAVGAASWLLGWCG